MTRFPRGVLVVVLVVVVLPVLFLTLFEKVVPYHIGVREVRFGGAGVDEEDYGAGFHLGVIGLHKWYFLPRSVHFLHYVSDPGRETLTTTYHEPLSIRTKDNNETVLEISVPYRIREGEGHRIIMKGYRQSYVERVHTTIVGVLREQLAELSSEELQDTEGRLQRTDDALKPLNTLLAEFHVEALGVLIRRVTFQAQYESQLQEKQFLVQKANLDRAQGLVANEAKVTNSIEKQIGAAEAKLMADWDKRFQEERSRFEVLIAQIRADARVYESRTKAEGDAEVVRLRAEGQLALDRARALRDELRNAALATRGGRIYLALQAAQNLKVPAVTLNSNDPRVPMILDLDEMTRVLMGVLDAEAP